MNGKLTGKAESTKSNYPMCPLRVCLILLTAHSIRKMFHVGNSSI